MLLHNAELETHIDLIADCSEQVDDWIMALAADIAALRNQMAQFSNHLLLYGRTANRLGRKSVLSI